MKSPWNDQDYINIAFAYRNSLEAWLKGHQKQYPSATTIIRAIRDEHTKAMLETKTLFGQYVITISASDQHKTIIFDTHIIVDPQYDCKNYSRAPKDTPTDIITYKSYFTQGIMFNFQNQMYDHQFNRPEFLGWLRHDRIVAIRPMPYSWAVEALVHSEESVRLVGQYVAGQQPLIEKFWPQGSANVK